MASAPILDGETMSEGEAMSEEEIVALLRKEEDAATVFYNSELADRQANALDFYDAQPFGDEEEGLSEYIEPIVEQTVDDMAIDIMEAFVSGDRVVEFEADGEAGEAAAADATEAIHHLFMRKQRGYRITLDWLQSGLIETIGIVKVGCHFEAVRKRRKLTVDQSQAMLLDPEGIVGAVQNEDGTLTVELNEYETVTQKRYDVMPLPSEEFLFSGRMKSLDDKEYKAHASTKTISELIGLGFDRDIVENLPHDDNSINSDSREAARWRDDRYDGWQETGEGVNRKVRLLEEYAHIDLDDDGIAELIRVFRVGDTILSMEEWDEQPFVAFCPYPRAHRLVGRSLAEKVMPDQRLESVVTRQMLNGLYASNMPRLWLPKESTTDATIDDLLSVRPGAIVRGQGAAPVNLSDNFDLSNSLTFLENLRRRRQARTGIIDLAKGMDRDALNDTAKGQDQLMQAGEKQIRYVARNFGEAMAEMFLKLMRLVRKHGGAMPIRVGGQYREIDPSTWPEEMDFSIKVGLGTNGKQRRIEGRLLIGQAQAEAQAFGLVQPKHVYKSAAGLVRDLGFGEPEDYFADPESPDFQPPEPQPDPEMAKAEAQAQLKAAELQAKQQERAAELQLREQEAAVKLENEREQAALRMQLEREKAELEAALARDKAQAEMQLAQQKMAFEQQMAERQFQHQSQLAERNAARADYQAQETVKMKKNREGGALDK